MRATWRSTVALTAIVTVIVAVVLAIAADAGRTSTAPDRYTESSGIKADAQVQRQGGSPRTAQVADLSAVASVSSITFVFGLLRPFTHSDASMGDAIVFAGSIDATGEKLVAGRAPREGHDGEFVTTRAVMERHHLSLGDRFRLLTLPTDQGAWNGFEVDTPDDAKGPRLVTRLVNVVDGPGELDDPSPVAIFSSSLLRLRQVPRPPSWPWSSVRVTAWGSSPTSCTASRTATNSPSRKPSS